jgi:hypothetical protein
VNFYPKTISWIEPLCGAAYVVHTQNVLVDKNGKINDIWNSSNGCIGNYWTESEEDVILMI